MRLKGTLLLMTILAASTAVRASDPQTHADRCGFLAGTYTVVGKELYSNQTYLGRVILRRSGECLLVERLINGERVNGEGRIAHALGTDEADVLRVRFLRRGKQYEITYLWQSDLDNYARISGYVYHPGIQTGTPGMEVLFIDREQ